MMTNKNTKAPTKATHFDVLVDPSSLAPLASPLSVARMQQAERAYRCSSQGATLEMDAAGEEARMLRKMLERKRCDNEIMCEMD